MRRRRLARVPASSANLGPGYDVLAAALALHLELEVEETGEFFVHSDVPGLPTDRSNLCVRAFEALHPADEISFEIRSRIPPSAGRSASNARTHRFDRSVGTPGMSVSIDSSPVSSTSRFR